MPPVQSIICYTGGAGGDFLKTLCLTQCDVDSRFNSKINNNGLVYHNGFYFSNLCVHRHYNQLTLMPEIDAMQLMPVENSHFYFDWFAQLSQRTVFIDYEPDKAEGIVEVYVSKRHHGNLQRFVDTNRHTLPNWLQDRVDTTNAVRIFATMWRKQIAKWHSDSCLQPVALRNFFDLKSLLSIAEQLLGRPVTDHDTFENHFVSWTEKNTVLKQLVC